MGVLVEVGREVCFLGIEISWLLAVIFAKIAFTVSSKGARGAMVVDRDTATQTNAMR